MSDKKTALPSIIKNTEELIFNSCYAPFNLSNYLHSAETRSRIRKLPAVQVFYSLQGLDQEEMALLLPQITEEQWSTFLDLDLWEKDELNTNALLHWEDFTLGTEDAVARKLLRATDPELLQLLWRRELYVIARADEEEFEEEPPADRDTLKTADNDFLVVLPEDPEKSRIISSFINRLYQIDADYARMSLNNSRYVTSIDLEETAYSNRCRRSGENGFQDYFTALEIYTPRSPESSLPEKEGIMDEISPGLPAQVSRVTQTDSIFLETLASISAHDDIEPLMQEMFFVCNKIISADRIIPSDPENIKGGISKALHGISLGLDIWADGNLPKATEGVTRHYLSSFFQVGFRALLKVREAASSVVSQEAGSYGEAVLEGLKAPYPLFTESEEKDGKITFSTRYFRTAAEIEETMELLGQLTI